MSLKFTFRLDHVLHHIHNLNSQALIGELTTLFLAVRQIRVHREGRGCKARISVKVASSPPILNASYNARIAKEMKSPQNRRYPYQTITIQILNILTK